MAPIASPTCNPPPAISTLIARGQWSRPAPALTRGVRPNSPQTTTIVSFNSHVLVEVFDQRRQALIQPRKLRFELSEVVAVRVPASPRKADATDAGGNQPAGEQEPVVFAILRPAVHRARHARTLPYFARTGRFFVQIERLGDRAGGDDADARSANESIAFIEPDASDSRFIRSSPASSFCRSSSRLGRYAAIERQVGASLAIGTKGAVDRAQKAMFGVSGEVDKRRRRAVVRALKFRRRPSPGWGGPPNCAAKIRTSPFRSGMGCVLRGFP